MLMESTKRTFYPDTDSLREGRLGWSGGGAVCSRGCGRRLEDDGEDSRPRERQRVEQGEDGVGDKGN